MDYFAYRLWFYIGGNLRKISEMALEGSIEMEKIYCTLILLLERASDLAEEETFADPDNKDKELAKI